MSATAIDLVDYNVTERTNIQDIRKDAIEPITLHAIVRDACVSAALLTHGTCTRHTNTARRARGALPDDPLGRALAVDCGAGRLLASLHSGAADVV